MFLNSSCVANVTGYLIVQLNKNLIGEKGLERKSVFCFLFPILYKLFQVDPFWKLAKKRRSESFFCVWYSLNVSETAPTET